MKISHRALLAATGCLLAGFAHAQSHGPFGIDHLVRFDNSGIYKRHTQLLVQDLTFLAIVGGGLWEGGDSRLGKTYWQSIDAAALGAVSSTGLKYVFERSRPSQTNDPNQWFKGKGHYSFPSGEVTFLSAAVTPFVLEYGSEHPAVYALELLPLYDSVARVKVHAHWQSDVIAGFALGFGAGYLAHRQDSPWILRAMPGSVQVGFKAKF
jgi:membrane-associated phospholipid phosphatase